MAIEFTPPPYKKPKVPEWATYVPKRSYKNGQWKVHTSRGHALNALSNRDGILYHLEGDEWREFYRKEDSYNGTCVLCGVGSGYGAWLMEPLKRIHLCGKCQRLSAKEVAKRYHNKLFNDNAVECPECSERFLPEDDNYLCTECRT